MVVTTLISCLLISCFIIIILIRKKYWISIDLLSLDLLLYYYYSNSQKVLDFKADNVKAYLFPHLEHDDLPEDANGDNHEVEHEDEAEEGEPHGGGQGHGQGPGHGAEHDGEVLQGQPAVQQPHQQLVEVDDGVPVTVHQI